MSKKADSKATKAGKSLPPPRPPPKEESEDDDEEMDEEEEEEEEEEQTDDDEEEDEEDEDEFEVQSSSEEDDDDDADSEDPDAERDFRKKERQFAVGRSRIAVLADEKVQGSLDKQKLLHVDDLSSDDEDGERRNTVGRIPLHWYDAFDHIGYDISGSKMQKRKGKDSIDMALQQRDNPSASRIVYDMYNDREVVLTDRQLELIRRVQAGAFAHPEFNDTPDYVDYVSGIKEVMPLSMVPERKSAFQPSKWEMKRVMQIAKAIEEGRYVFGGKTAQKQRERAEQQLQQEQGYLIWKEDEDDVELTTRQRFHLPAPKLPLPGHAESYNPPSEYLFSAEEEAEYNALDSEEQRQRWKPQQFSCLRHVPAYADFVRERFERCLDLYLCPRKLKQRLNIDPEALVPKLPHPRELKPFPNSLVLQYQGHVGTVTCLALSPDGQYLASGGVDGTVRLWETDTCLCRHVWSLATDKSDKSAVQSLAWNPDVQTPVLAVGVGVNVYLITTGTGDAESRDSAESLVSAVLEAAGDAEGAAGKGTKSGRTSTEESEDEEEEESEEEEEGDGGEEEDGEKSRKQTRKTMTVHWQRVSSTSPSSSSTTAQAKIGPRVYFSVSAPVSQVTWHHKGDYLAVLSPQASPSSHMISIHQISKNQSQWPFGKAPGQRVQRLLFHPLLPVLIVMTQQHVKVYHLVEQRLVKKLLSGCKWLSSMDIHPSGDHLLVGSFDRRVVWFDLDLGSSPYKTLKFHEKAVRDIAVHRRYPLFASASDDGSVHVFHGMVYSDFTRNPLIVPLKVLRGHGREGELGVTATVFHPKQPWLFTAGADGLINLYQDL